MFVEGLVHALLIQRAFHRLIEKTLIHIAIIRAERGRENFIAYVESIDDTDGIWTDRGEHLLEACLERRNVFVAQTGKL